MNMDYLALMNKKIRDNFDIIESLYNVSNDTSIYTFISDIKVYFQKNQEK